MQSAYVLYIQSNQDGSLYFREPEKIDQISGPRRRLPYVRNMLAEGFQPSKSRFKGKWAFEEGQGGVVAARMKG